MARTAAQIRQEFVEFFRQRCGHVFVPSSPVVPLDDPTLLFTNAGMNQFKPYFLGTETPKHRRVANTQKCIRAGGKHNDLDDVGHDTYHHTFFEMLGNWSFGDYFKKEAIAWAWELLTKVWGIDAARLHATYFGGDPAEGLEPDTEARDLWRQILPPERVHAGVKKDNFWEMGETGPCGPCSEIHIDLTSDKSGGQLVNAGDSRVMEIWNLVFIQFNRGPDGNLTPLPAKHVDTGMGFERVTAVIQGHNNNYATDVFVPIIQEIERISGHRYGEHGPPARSRHEGTEAQRHEGSRYATMRPGNMQDEACRVIADHIRCLTFALTDGAVPDRDGRGYVLRRILRRAVRFGWQYLDLREPFLCRLVDVAVSVMGEAFPELRKDPAHVCALLREEEESFERTLDRGIALFEEAADFAVKHHHGEIRGEDAFKLHDTYGFPIDLTQIMAEEQRLRVDVGEYERLMEAARERARACGKGFQATGVTIPLDLLAPYRPTDDLAKYTSDRLGATVRAIVHCGPDGAPALLPQADRLKPGDTAGLVFDQTCFYAEAGGQVGDRGQIVDPGVRFDVEDTQRIGDVVVHFGALVQGEIAIGQKLELEPDRRRPQTMKNHTGTHVLNWALREALGDHVQQKGSLVDAEKTRFDFSHPKALTLAEIERIEQLANAKIAANLPVYYENVPQQEALKINGLRAIFGERYPDIVRVLSIGAPVADLIKDPANPRWRECSVEFCGGTHVRSTGEIERLVIISEEAVAKGIRRLVAYTGLMAQLADETGAALVARAEQLKQGPPADAPAGALELQNTLTSATIPIRHRARLRDLLGELQLIAKEQHKADAADAASVVRERIEELLKTAPKIGGTTIVVAEMPDVPAEQLKHGADVIKQKCCSAAVLFGVRVLPEEDDPNRATSPSRDRQGADNQSRDRKGAVLAEPGAPAPGTCGKALLLAAFTSDLNKKGLKAGDLVKAIAPLVGGGGGGPPTMAQAGGKNPEKLGEALEAGQKWITEKLR